MTRARPVFNFLKGKNPKRQSRMNTPRTFQDLKTIIKEAGLQLLEGRGKGGHYGVATPEGNIITVIPFHGGSHQIPEGTMKSILRKISEFLKEKAA